MIAYGTKIKSDIDFPVNISNEGAYRNVVKFSSKLPTSLENSIICGFHLFWAHNREVYLYGDREININEPGQIWQYEVKGIASFYWAGEERTIYYKLDESATLEHLSFWFIHMVLPFYLALEHNCEFLHAGAVDVDGNAIAFIAPSMGGKSTMTDYFIRRGHSLITDDKLPVFIENNKFIVTNSHPYHRPYRQFETLGNRVKNFTSDFKSLHRFYVLEQSEVDTSIIIEEIKGFSKINILSRNYLFPQASSAARRLSYLCNMLNTIKIFNVQVPWTKNRLSEVYDAICEHSKEIK